MKTYPLYLNGEWVTTKTTIPVVDPATAETFAEVCTIDRDGMRQVLEDAQAALPGWRSLTGMQRGDYLLAIAAEVRRRANEIATIMTRENGKPLAESRAEVNGTIDHLRWFAEEARRAYGRIVPHQAPGKRHLVLKQPVGVVGAIAPWNFPLILSIRKAAPALAAGCTVVLKPASATPLCNLLFAECVAAAGVPAGVFQVVLGKASQIAAEMLENPICRKISFTGSTPVGKRLIEGAAQDVYQAVAGAGRQRAGDCLCQCGYGNGRYRHTRCQISQHRPIVYRRQPHLRGTADLRTVSHRLRRQTQAAKNWPRPGRRCSHWRDD